MAEPHIPPPSTLENDQLVSIILDGIGGQRRSFARWALYELASRLESAEQNQEPDPASEPEEGA